MKRKILIYICLLAIILVTSSCTPVVETPTSVLNTATPQLITINPSPQPDSDSTPSESLHTPATPFFESSTPSDSFAPLCINEGKSVDFDGERLLSGNILFQHENQQGLFSLDATTQQVTQIVATKNPIQVYGISPNGMWLAYSEIHKSEDNSFDYLTPSVILINTTGENIVMTLDYQSLIGTYFDLGNNQSTIHIRSGEWINDDLLLFDLEVISQGAQQEDHVPIVYDPFQNEWQLNWFAEIPHQYRVMAGTYSHHEWKLSPDLDLLISPSLSEFSIALSPTTEFTMLWANDNINDYPSESIEWALDSQKAAIAIPLSRLLILSRDGQVQEIATFNSPLPRFTIQDIKWSPDSRYLGIYGLITDSNSVDDKATFLLFDSLLMEYVFYCHFEEFPLWSIQMTWSPDNQWVLFSSPARPLFIMNIQSQDIFLMRDEGSVVAWINSIFVESKK